MTTNLLAPECLERLARRRRARRWRTLVLVLTCATAAGVSGSIASRPVGAEPTIDTETAKSIATLKARIERTEARVLASNDSVRVAVWSDARPDWGRMLAWMGEACGESVVLDRWTLTQADRGEAERWSMSLHGKALDRPSLDGFVHRLEESGLFARVRLVESRRVQVLQREAVEWSVTLVAGQEMAQATEGER